MKKATAILLQNMLARIKNLESQVENVIVNSTMEFKHLSKAIKSLNKTINNLTRPVGKEHSNVKVLCLRPVAAHCQSSSKFM